MDSKNVTKNARLEDEYKGYNLFTQVNNLRIRTWNQLNTFLNILSIDNKTTAGEYLNCLADNGRAKVVSMIEELKEKGYTKLHKEVWDTNVYS